MSGPPRSARRSGHAQAEATAQAESAPVVRALRRVQAEGRPWLARAAGAGRPQPEREAVAALWQVLAAEVRQVRASQGSLLRVATAAEWRVQVAYSLWAPADAGAEACRGHPDPEVMPTVSERRRFEVDQQRWAWEQDQAGSLPLKPGSAVPLGTH